MLAGNLEYTISSLPNLSFQNSEDIKRHVSGIFSHYSGKDVTDIMDSFITEVSKFLSDKQLSFLQDVDLKTIHYDIYSKSGVFVIREFSLFEKQLKSDIRDLRINRIKGNKQDDASVIKSGNPLDEELQIMKLQWYKIEELSSDHPADFNTLVAYKLKLMILLRWWSFNEKLGLENYQKATDPKLEGGDHE
jgi:hypothetical protein